MPKLVLQAEDKTYGIIFGQNLSALDIFCARSIVTEWIN